MTGPLVTRLQLAVSLVALAAVVWWALRQDAPTFPRTAEAGWALAAGLGIYALATLARAERWHRILGRSGVPATRGDAYRLTTVGYMGNNVLPARGGDILRAFLLAPRTGTRKRTILGTVVADRLLDALALALLFLVLVLAVVQDANVPGGRALAFAAAGAAILALAAAAAFVVLRRSGVLARVHNVVRALVAPTRALASPHGAALLLLTIALWLLEAGVYVAVARAADLDLGVLDAVYVVALTNLFALVPAAPGYVGTFDAAVLFGVGSLGASGSEAVAFLLLLRFVLFVPITLVGFAFLVARYGGWGRSRAARVETTEA